MTDLFLRRVELSNFRVYGESYVFDFDAAPGVTLIMGPNGLGKTTFFDGLEWALTGQVSRFSGQAEGRRKRSPLTRLGQPDDTHRVSLQFSDGAPLDRGLGFAPAPEAVVDLLRAPSWPSVGDLHRYLSITHFLGQSASMRFSVRSPTDQWEALKGPAGVDRINFVKERIGGQAARRAFTRVIQDASKALSECNAALTEWTELLAERDRLRQLSASEAAVAPTALPEAAGELARRIVQLAPHLAWTEVTSADPAESVLGRLASLASAAEEHLRSDAARLQGLQGRAAEFTGLLTEIAALTAQVAELERAQLETAESLRAAEIAVAEADRTLAAARQRAADAEARLARYARAASAADQLRAAEAAIAEIDAAVEASDKATQAASTRHAELLQKIADAGARLEERRRLVEQLAAARTRLDLTERWTHVRAERLRLEGLVAATDPEALRTRREGLLSDGAKAAAEIADLNGALRELDERARAIAEGVAAIAAHLTEHDLDCPVCASKFGEGELLRKAQSPPALVSPSAAELAEKLAAATVRRNGLVEQLRQTDAALSQHIQLQTSLTQQKSLEGDLLQKLAEAGAVTSDAPDREGALKAIADIEAAQSELQAKMDRQEPLEDLKALQQGATADLEAEAARRAELARRRTEQAAIAETARAVLRQSPEVWTAEAGLVADFESVRRQASDEAGTLAAQVAPLAAAAEARRQEADLLRQRAAADASNLDQSGKRLTQLTKRRQELASAWTGAGLSGEPDESRLATLVASAGERTSEVERLGERQKALSAGYRRWTQDEALRDAESRIAERLGELETPQEVTAAMEAAVAAAQRRLDVAQRARVRMDEVVAQMQVSADSYAEGVLEPLNKTIGRFSRALMTWADDLAINYSATHHASRSELRQNTVVTLPSGETSPIDINPNHFFSEGQLSALSVSALLAASTTFRWSRWPALLMDDPLQHNDVIHASAFMDLMRQLVRQLRYQVIMSTHDSAEAAFLIRKCRSAGIPLRVHELLPPGNDGLVSVAA